LSTKVDKRNHRGGGKQGPKVDNDDHKIPYVAIEQAILETKQLSAMEKLFYIILKSFRNRQSKLCFPSMRRVMERCGISKDTAYLCRKKLQKLGIIDYSTERGRKHRNHYRFIFEDGGKQEIERVLSVLSQEKIGENKDTLNSRNEGQRAVLILGNKIGENKDTNHMNITKRNRTHSEPGVCVALPEEIKQYIDDKVSCKRDQLNDVSAYRVALVKAYQRGELDMSDHADILKELRDPWDVAGSQADMDVDKTSDAYRITKLLFDYNMERNPDYKVSEVAICRDIKNMQSLLAKHPAKEVEAVLTFCHQHNVMETFLWDGFMFSNGYDQLKERFSVIDHLETL
jgi:hypothetical protein